MLDFFVCFSIHATLHPVDVLSDLVGGQGEKYYYQEKNFEISYLDYYISVNGFSDFFFFVILCYIIMMVKLFVSFFPHKK